MEVTETTNELVKVVETSGVEPQTATTLKESFLPFFEQAEEWKRKAEALVVTDATQVHDMKMARTARLALKEIRVNADKKRKELKEDSLRYGKAVQGVYNVIEYLIAPIEKHLEDQEKFAEIQEAKRKAELNIARKNEIQPFVEFIPYELNLGELSEDVYAQTLKNAKILFQAKIEAEQKAEAEERERIRIENKRLKAEAEAKEKQLAEERAKAEAERKARKEAEAKVIAEQKAKALLEKKAKAAPDKAKLNDFAKMLDELTLPELKSEEANKVLSDAKTLLQKVSTFIREKSSII